MANKILSAASNPITQIIWAGTKYVGCAIATSKQSGAECTSMCPLPFGWYLLDDPWVLGVLIEFAKLLNLSMFH